MAEQKVDSMAGWSVVQTAVQLVASWVDQMAALMVASLAVGKVDLTAG